ncbi:hypothetical protein EDEG_03720 [Edhazardia aedis USNM 41457]|uniref:Uncharacterized protein n=1 Tax=Edhazardia aedis (strain USNM 41457) TaxID=1003232 RepID=J8ZPY2_EDHAE|nr:hypothetical protein EDEG_03720 [Edhazardia aedis USNM 41457]|eukprot:EJW01753.1 hypothetical protein EDEG_03720 [Edhazardia aedis USNM 41457]
MFVKSFNSFSLHNSAAVFTSLFIFMLNHCGVYCSEDSTQKTIPSDSNPENIFSLNKTGYLRNTYDSLNLEKSHVVSLENDTYEKNSPHCNPANFEMCKYIFFDVVLLTKRYGSSRKDVQNFCQNIQKAHNFFSKKNRLVGYKLFMDDFLKKCKYDKGSLTKPLTDGDPYNYNFLYNLVYSIFINVMFDNKYNTNQIKIVEGIAYPNFDFEYIFMECFRHNDLEKQRYWTLKLNLKEMANKYRKYRGDNIYIINYIKITPFKQLYQIENAYTFILEIVKCTKKYNEEDKLKNQNHLKKDVLVTIQEYLNYVSNICFKLITLLFILILYRIFDF